MLDSIVVLTVRIKHLHLSTVITFMSLLSLSINAAEEEFTLLTIQGDLIGKIDSLDLSSDRDTLLNSYYNLLPQGLRTEIKTLRQILSTRIPDYEVAVNAGDSAEFSEIKDEIDLYWAAIRSIHIQHFTREVVDLLGSIYNNEFPFSL